jgi:hypothetical protein
VQLVVAPLSALVRSPVGRLAPEQDSEAKVALRAMVGAEVTV